MINLLLTTIILNLVSYQETSNQLSVLYRSTLLRDQNKTRFEFFVKNNSFVNIESMNLRLLVINKDNKEIGYINEKRIGKLYANDSRVFEHTIHDIGSSDYYQSDVKILINSVRPSFPFEITTKNLNSPNNQESKLNSLTRNTDIKPFPIAGNHLGVKVDLWNGLTKMYTKPEDPFSTMYNLDKSLIPSVLDNFECKVLVDNESGIVYKAIFTRIVDKVIGGSEFQRLRKILDSKYSVTFSNLKKIEITGANLSFLDEFIEKYDTVGPLFIHYEYAENQDLQIDLIKNVTLDKVNVINLEYSIKSITAIADERIKKAKEDKRFQEDEQRKEVAKDL